MDWDKLRVFHAVASAGSLTHAGESLGLSQSAVSRQVRGLEEDVGAPLFHRHPRGLLLTQEGEHLYSATQAISREVHAAGARIRDARDEVSGDLRITTTVGFGTLWLAPRLDRLFERAPNLGIELILSELVLNLPMREADVAIRMREPNQADVVRRPLMESCMRMYASETYIAEHGAPRTAEDLMSHRILAYSPTAPQPIDDPHWLQRHLPALNPRLTVNNYYTVLQAAQNHLGIAAIPDYMVRERGGLVNVAPDVTSASYTIYLVYPEELRGSQRIAIFREFILEEIESFGHQTATPPS